MQEMSEAYLNEFEGIKDSDSFFSPAEKSLLVYSCMSRISSKTVSGTLIPHST